MYAGKPNNIYGKAGENGMAGAKGVECSSYTIRTYTIEECREWIIRNMWTYYHKKWYQPKKYLIKDTQKWVFRLKLIKENELDKK